MKYVLEVGIRFQTVDLGGFDQAEESRAGFGSSGVAGKQPVLAADDKGADGVFSGVVVRF